MARGLLSYWLPTKPLTPEFDMTTLFITFISLGLIGLAGPYLIYPMLVRARARRAPKTEIKPLDHVPSVSVLIPAHNEAEAIADKVANCMALRYPRDRFEVLIGCDACTDATADVASALDTGKTTVRVFDFEERKGKIGVLQALADEARGQILLLTDASAQLGADVVKKVVTHMESRELDAAGARYVIQKGSDADVDRQYWSEVSDQHVLEDYAECLVGLHGAAWAIRAERLVSIPPETVNDDYVWPLEVLRAGGRVGYVPNAVAFEASDESLAGRFRRWRRIARGNWQMIADALRHEEKLPSGAWLNLMVLKLGKTLTPLSATLFAVGIIGLVLSINSGLAGIMLAAIAIVIALALAMPKTRKMVVWVAFIMAAYTLGAWDALRGKKQVGWRRPEEAGTRLVPDVPRPPMSVRVTKRAIDILGATVGLLLAGPVMFLVAIAIRLDSKGPAIYSQERVRAAASGKERTFVMHKFRSMRTDAETGSGPVWAQDEDPRITRVGKFIRKTRLDELPQLFDVLVGNMSLVGPRPERQHFTEQLRDMIPGYDDRVTALKPGVTGLAQIHCGYDTTLEGVRTKLAYDLAYAMQLYNFWGYLKTEVRVILETVVVALTGRGAK